MLLFQSTNVNELSCLSTPQLIAICKNAKNQIGKGFTQNPLFQQYFRELMRRGNWNTEEKRR